MIKYLLFVFLFTFVDTLCGQTNKASVVSVVKDDQIRIKWFPSSYEEIQACITHGYTIDRAEIKPALKAEMADFSNSKKVIFNSQKIKLQAMDLEDTISQESRAVLDPFISKNPPKDAIAKDYSFALFTLQNAISSELAEISGLSHTDTDFDKKSTYAYRISVKGMPLMYIKVDASENTVYPEISDLSLKLDKKKTVDVEWNAKLYTEYGFGFQLEKSLDTPLSGNILNERPIVPVKTDTEKEGKLDSYRDEDLTEGKYHYYRLTGLNYFGEPSFYSPWKRIYVPNHVNAEVYIDSLYRDGMTRIVEGFAMQSGPKKMKVDRFVLEQSKSRDKDFEKIDELGFADSTFRFTVNMPLTGDQFYYRVAAISSDNDTVFSNADYFFTLDQEPPGPVAMKSGKIDSSGVVELVWTPSTDKDIKGYRIFRANALDEEFQEVNKELSPASAYTDKIRLDNLTPEVYYFVRSVDNNYNNSINSDTLLVMKPDTIAPVVGYLYKPQRKDTTCILTWANSSSSDVAMNVLLHTHKDKTDTLFKWFDEQSSFEYSKLNPGQNHSFQIITLDNSGNKTEGEIRSFYFEPGYRKPLSKPAISANRTDKTIELNWQKPNEEIFNYQIYKSNKNGGFDLIKTLESPTELIFIDKNIRIGRQYKYYIKYITKTGIHSLPSQPAEIVY